MYKLFLTIHIVGYCTCTCGGWYGSVKPEMQISYHGVNNTLLTVDVWYGVCNNDFKQILKPEKYMAYLSTIEFHKIARELEQHHAVFERLWNFTKIRVIPLDNPFKIPTAAVILNTRTGLTEMIVVKEFWERQTHMQRCFIIAHECSHVIYNHLHRVNIEKYDALAKVKLELANVAQDIVINHGLVERYGFILDEIAPIDEKTGTRPYCWLETVFPDDPHVLPNMNFEYYYNMLLAKLKDQYDEVMEMLDNLTDLDIHDMQPGEGEGMQIPVDMPGSRGNPGEGEGDGDSEGDGEDGKPGKGGTPDAETQKALDELDPKDFQYVEHGGDYTQDFQEILGTLGDQLSASEKHSIQKPVEDNLLTNPVFGPTGIDGEGGETDSKGGDKPSGGQKAGTTAGTQWLKVDEKPIVVNRKFESIITDWSKKTIRPVYVERDQWAHRARRYSSFLSNNPGTFMSSSRETSERAPVKTKIDVWFYQDTSGSCQGYTDRFFSIAESMPLDRFNMRMFCFDTKVYETSLESRELFGFGGTYFHILENHIQDTMQAEEIKYPDCVFVVTDGYGSDILPAECDKWHWLLTPGASTDNIPSTCNVYDLEDYE